MSSKPRPDYAFEKCVRAAEDLAVSHDPLWKRLADAWAYNLLRLLEPDVPPEAWAKFREFRREIEARIPAGADAEHGTIVTVLSSARAEDVEKLAKLVWEGISHVLWNVPQRSA